MNNIKIVYHNKIDVSEEMDVSKTSESKESNIYPSWYFLNKGLQFQPNVYNTGKDSFMIFMNLSDKAILNIESTICCCIVSGININCVVLWWCKWCHVVAISSYHYCTDD